LGTPTSDRNGKKHNAGVTALKRQKRGWWGHQPRTETTKAKNMVLGWLHLNGKKEVGGDTNLGQFILFNQITNHISQITNKK